MNGAESLVHTLLASGVDTCFANPGTSEMHFVAALDRIPGMHCVLGLFEGVVTGAADGYARASGKPAATLLHCGPGLANGLANLHNARRSSTPIVNIVGDQATYHRPLDAPLTGQPDANTLADILGREDPRLERMLGLNAVAAHWHELPRREQEILLMDSRGDMTQTEIGLRFGISQMHVSRLRTRALGHLRSRLLV